MLSCRERNLRHLARQHWGYCLSGFSSCTGYRHCSVGLKLDVTLTLPWRLFRASQTASTTSQAVMGPAVLLLADVSLSWLPFSKKILGISRSAIFSPTPCTIVVCCSTVPPCLPGLTDHCGPVNPSTHAMRASFRCSWLKVKHSKPESSLKSVCCSGAQAAQYTPGTIKQRAVEALHEH